MIDIDLHDVSKRFGDVQVLDKFNAHFAGETITALMGPSGVGKSTILRLIAGLTSPDFGRIEIGDNASQNRAQNVRVAYLPQGESLLPWLTSLENVLLPIRVGLGKRTASSSDLERAKALLDDMGLRATYSFLPRALSGGMKQRVAIARSLFLKPNILLLDEPFSALDEPTRWRLEAKLYETVVAHKLTCIVVTHNVDQAVSLASSIVLLQGPPAQTIKHVSIRAQDGQLTPEDRGRYVTEIRDEYKA